MYAVGLGGFEVGVDDREEEGVCGVFWRAKDIPPGFWLVGYSIHQDILGEGRYGRRTGKSTWVFDSKHYGEQWEVIQACEADFQSCFQADDGDSGGGECQVEDENCRQEEELEGEEDGTEEELVEVVVA